MKVLFSSQNFHEQFEGAVRRLLVATPDCELTCTRDFEAAVTRCLSDPPDVWITGMVFGDADVANAVIDALARGQRVIAYTFADTTTRAAIPDERLTVLAKGIISPQEVLEIILSAPV